MSGLKPYSSPLELLCLFFSLLTLSGIIRGHEGTGVKVSVKEGSDVVLPCSLSTKQDITAAVFDWRKVAPKDEGQKVFYYDANTHYNNGRTGQSEEFRGRVSHFEDQLNHGDASIIIRDTKMADSGNYTCDFPRLQPRQTFYIEFVVVVTPEPYIRTLDATDVWSLLQCEVRGASPKPEVEWQDSDGNRLPAAERQVSERGGSYDITLNITVNQTDHYRCVATQKTINHQIHAEIFVHICEKVFQDSSTKEIIGWLALGLVLGGSVVLAVLALLVFVKYITIRCNNSPRHQENGSDDQGEVTVHLENGSVHLETRSYEDPSALLPQSTEAS